jgi:hypothetical protein
MNVSDIHLKRTTSQVSLASALENLRRRVDYVIITTEPFTSFGSSIFATADALLVSIRSGRRQGRNDIKLARVLDRSGDRFLGVIAVQRSTVYDTPFPAKLTSKLATRRQAAHTDDSSRGDVADVLSAFKATTSERF